MENPGAGKTYWFGHKTFGFGMMPISWQGWLLTLGFLVFALGVTYASRYMPNQRIAAPLNALAVIVALAVYLRIAQKHMKPSTGF